MTKAFVVGHPIKHSRSPLIHGYWLKQYGLEGSYERIDVAPVNFGEFLKGFRSQGFAGGNVTIPHKEAAFLGVERRTAQAERVGAVNTLWIEDGVLWGDNTDVPGFMANLDSTLGTGWEQDVDTALVLGAGGAARAVVAGVQDRPLKRIVVANRTLSKAEDLVRDLGSGSSVALAACALEAIPQAIPQARLIVNTTSLGMPGQPPLPVDLSRAPRDAIVADIVYVPLETPLLAAAAAQGLRTVDGLGMLLHQAVPGFRRWFGVTPKVTPELRALILADIERHR
ncbi:shikimate dehydrogenase [Microvirga lotononidis]|uniref:Shikimate dehydrogenase (NADP(+)) n=1 Tax=Microvirga lotononidis TaxID=864069 RepID=I4YZ08_9HYPH|nr:shikimate dehydrogenase [Microvirga lotononidis]EIM29200.1 shikimate 5-dehydrogenase [Microvirga lotononidis]WQO29039.1 shikimate dehydrogenase [Microvirga lotononidis]